MKFYIHDYLVEKTECANKSDAFLYHYSILCSLRKEYNEDEIERYSISVGNPAGIEAYLVTLNGLYIKNVKKSFFISDKFFVTEFYDEENIVKEIKELIEGIAGKTKRF